MVSAFECRFEVDFGDVNPRDSLKGLEESDIKAMLEAQKDLEGNDELENWYGAVGAWLTLVIHLFLLGCSKFVSSS